MKPHDCQCHHCNTQMSVHNTNTPHNAWKEYGRIVLSALLLFIGIVMSGTDVHFFQEAILCIIWYAAAYLPVGWPVLKEAWQAGRKGDVFSEFTLMSIASFGAFYIGEYPEGVAVMLFYSLGEMLQGKAVYKARQHISALLDVRPKTATVLRNGETVIVNPRQVTPGETIEVKPGERVPLDGMMLTESADLNSAALTGESLPYTATKGKEVLSGMIAIDKVIQIKVTKPFNESALSRILDMVEHAAQRKAPAELFIRKFARIYTPIVTGLAALMVLLPWLWAQVNTGFAFSLDEWLYRALVFLVISCPCALVISIPLSYFGGIGAASRVGVLFKGGNYLNSISQTNTVVFDKTGTLTKGNFYIQQCNPTPSFSTDQLIQVIASAEQHSTHPIAKAIAEYAEGKHLDILPVTDATETGGHGIETTINGHRILVGNERILDKYNIKYPSLHTSHNDGTLVHCAIDGEYAGNLLLSDELKEDAAQAIEALKALNINNIQMLSGDKQPIVTNFAQKLGLEKAYGGLLPEDKVKHLEELRKDKTNRIVFVGDGINDAPVLALSHVGIAMGGLGSDAAIETADVVIQTDQPSKVATAIRAGRQTRRIVWQNITLAFGVKLIVLFLGTVGIANLWEAVFADVGVALIAVLNAIRIQKLIK